MYGKNLNKWRVEFMVNFSKHYFVYAEDEQDAWEKADEVMAQDTTITPRFATKWIEHTDCTIVYPRYEVGELVAFVGDFDEAAYGVVREVEESRQIGIGHDPEYYIVQILGFSRRRHPRPKDLRKVSEEEAKTVEVSFPEPGYKVVAYVRAEADEPEIHSSLEDAQAELENLEAMNDGETTYEIEEVVDG